MKFKLKFICFLFILCSFVSLKTNLYAADVPFTNEAFYNMVMSKLGYSYKTDYSGSMDKYIDSFKQSECAVAFLIRQHGSTNYTLAMHTYQSYQLDYRDKAIEYCSKNGGKYLFSNLILDKNNTLCYVDRYGCSTYNSSFNYIFFGNDYDGGYVYSWNSTYFPNTKDYYIDIVYDTNGLSPSGVYDSSIGYLSNVVVKRGSSMLLTAIDTDITNLIDRYSWGSVTSTGKSLDGVDVKILFYRNEENVVEKEIHFECPPNEYFFDWSSFVELNLKDWLVGSLYRYEIFLRPTVDVSCGDYCYFNVNFPSTALEQMKGTIDPTYLTDDIQYCPSVGNVEDFKDFERPDKTTPIYVPHYVTNNRPSDDIKDDLRDDDKVPPSDPSHSTVINNINNVVNNYDNEEGNGLIDSISDLLGFFKNFLSFIGLFITSVLSNFTFIPNWVIKLMEGTILAFIVISIIKTVIK